MLRRIVLILMAAALMCGSLLTAQAYGLSQEERYSALLEELHSRLNGEDRASSLDRLAEGFQELGSYKKSAQFSYYTAILRDAEEGKYDNLSRYVRLLDMDRSFPSVLTGQGLPSVEEVKAYAYGRQAEDSLDWAAAIEYYAQSASVLDSLMRADRLMTAKPVCVKTGVVQGDYTIDTYSNGTCVIADYTGSAEQLEIPEVIGGYPVVGIGDEAFEERTSLTSISIPNSVTFIGESAFFQCTSLTSISIPDSVTSIGDYAFCSCTSLTSISIPDSVTSIGEAAFIGCISLASISIPDSVTSIGGGAFAGCLSLSNIRVSNNHPTLQIIDGVLIDKANKRLICYPSALQAVTYTIPEGIQIIGLGAFAYCTSLTSISIPDSITSIGDYTFKRCDSLTSINIPDSVTSIGEEAFLQCTSLTSISIPDSVTSIGQAAFAYCTSLTSISIPDSVTSIGEDAFSDCRKLTLRVPANSYAHQYAIDNDIPCTTY